MRKYEYKVVPAPTLEIRRGFKRKSLSAEDQLAEAMNALGEHGWEFLRSDEMAVRRRGLFGRGKTTRQRILVFARQVGTIAQPEDAARAVLTEPLAFPVQPRRIRNEDAVANVKNGARKITVAAEDGPADQTQDKPAGTASVAHFTAAE